MDADLKSPPPVQKLKTDVFTDYKNHPDTAFTGNKRKLIKALGGPKKEAETWLQRQDAFALHAPWRRKESIKHLKTVATTADDYWQADVADMSRGAPRNDRYRYILVVIDVFSKYAWAVPLKTKGAIEVTQAFEEIFKQSGRHPKIGLTHDEGREFENETMRNLAKKYGFEQTRSQDRDIKASLAEHLVKTERYYMEIFYSN